MWPDQIPMFKQCGLYEITFLLPMDILLDFWKLMPLNYDNLFLPAAGHLHGPK